MKTFYKVFLLSFLALIPFCFANGARIDFLNYTVDQKGTTFNLKSDTANDGFSLWLYPKNNPTSFIILKDLKTKQGSFSVLAPAFLMSGKYAIQVSSSGIDPYANPPIPPGAPRVIAENGLANVPIGKATLSASAWSSDGIPVDIEYYFKWWIEGKTQPKATTPKKFTTKKVFYEQIDYTDKTGVYCFIPYAYKTDGHGKAVSPAGQSEKFCFPSVPYVATMYPVAVKETSAYFKGEILDFRGLNSAYTFFRRYYASSPNNYKEDGGQIIDKSINAKTQEFGWFFSGFNTKQGDYCYKACAKATKASLVANCGKEICLLRDRVGQEEKDFQIFKQVEPFTTEDDCQKAKITLDVYCGGEITTSARPDLDIVLLIDKSGTMKGEALDITKNAASNFVNKLDKDHDRVSLITFSDWGSYTHGMELTNDFAKVNQAITNIKVSGRATNLGDAYKKANDLFSAKARKGARKIIIAITDGIVNAGQFGEAPDSLSYPIVDNVYTNYAINQANIFKNNGGTNYIIRYSELAIDQMHSRAASFSKLLLQKMSSPGKYYSAPLKEAITQLFARILYSIITVQESEIICKDVKVYDVLTENSSFSPTPNPAVPPFAQLKLNTPKTGQTTLIWNLGDFKGHRRIEFVVYYKTPAKQLAEIYPDSKVEYKDENGVVQKKEFAETQVENLVPCGICGDGAVNTAKGEECEKTETWEKFFARTGKDKIEWLLSTQMCDDSCKLGEIKVGVTKRIFDHIQDILDRLKIKYDDNILVEQYSDISKYDVIFMNCSYGNWSQNTADAMKQYLQNKGVIYLTDLNYVYLERYFSDQFKPSRLFDQGDHSADVVDAELAMILGKNNITVKEDMGGAKAGDIVDRSVARIFLSETAGPISFLTKYSNGYIFFSAYHNAAQGSDQDAALKYFVLQSILLRKQ